MLAALDALIAHGKGGRAAISLRQATALLLRVGFDEESDAVALFDELMATLAMDLDDESLAVLAPELTRMPGLLTAFTSTVMSRFHELSLRPPAESAPVQDPALAAPAVPAVQLAVEDRTAPAPPPTDRRTTPRDPVEDSANPLTLARRASPRQLEDIAGLPALPEALTAIIANRGHGPAITIALANPGARFARSTLAMLTELAAADRALRTSLATRDDLPADAFDRLWPLLGREARARAIMVGVTISDELARRALASAEADATDALRAGCPHQTLSELRGLVADASLTASDMLFLLASEGRMAELAALAVSELGLSFGVAFAMVRARLDYPAAILVRALGGDNRALQAVVNHRHKRTPALGGNVSGAFGQLDADEACLLARLVEQHHAEAVAAAEAPSPARPALALVS